MLVLASDTVVEAAETLDARHGWRKHVEWLEEACHLAEDSWGHIIPGSFLSF